MKMQMATLPRRVPALRTWLALWLAAGAAAAADTVTVDPAARYQVMEGWGTSLCWWAHVVGQWSDPRRREAADLVFDPQKGLGLNVVRYNIGGGDNPEHSHMRVGGNVPGYRPGENGPYDWSVDPGQRWMLEAAIARGADRLEAFANSPPWWMTHSGCTSGSRDGESENLRPEYVTAYADYLADVVDHFRTARGVTFQTLDPFNEPGGNWWKEKEGQEGCRILPATQNTVARRVAKALKERQNPTRLATPDAHSIDWALNTLKAYDRTTLADVVRINVHAYKGERRAEVRNWAERHGKGVWMSEVDHAGRGTANPHDHSDMYPGLVLANAIIRDLRDLQPTAWVFWQAIENEQYCVWWKFNYGLLHGDFMHGTEAIHRTRKYDVMGQFSRFIRPGSRMVGTDSPDTVAFTGPDGDRLIIVSVNSATEARERRMDLSGFVLNDAAAARWRSSVDESREALGRRPVTDGLLVLREPAQSITTCIVDGASYSGPTKVNDTCQSGTGNRFEYVGEWAFTGREPSAFTRDNHWGWRPDDYYLVHFRGTRIALHCARDNNAGIAAISLNNGMETRVDLYHPERLDQAPVYTSPVLPRGMHVLKVRVTGDRNPASSHPVIPADRADITP